MGICTCGNNQPRRLALATLITERSIQDIDKMLETDFGREKHLNITLPYDFLKRSIANKTEILLEAIREPNQSLALNELAVWLSFKWKVGEVIRIKFLNRDAKLEELVKKAADEWIQYANIRFNFTKEEDAEIRIEFNNLDINQSQIGTSCRSIKDLSEPTMMLGFSNPLLDEEIIYGTILHEFGHVLGCIHEHQQPDAEINWNEAEIIKDYAAYGWNETKIRLNILNKLSPANISNTDYDKNSIMHYNFTAKYNLDNIEYPLNTSLSDQDKDFIRFCYPY